MDENSGDTIDHQLSLSGRLARGSSLATPSLPSFELIERTIGRILDKYDAPQKPPDREIERLFAQMLQRIRGDDWRKVPMSFVTRVASAAFEEKHRRREDLADLRRFLFAEVRASDRPGFLAPMMRIYTDSYEAGASHTADLAEALRSVRDRIGARWQKVLQEIPELLDPREAPTAVAAMMSKMDDPWHGLRAKGVRQPHAPGLMDFAHLAFVDRISPQLGQVDQIERLLTWLRPAGQAPRQIGAGKAIEALLGIWIDRTPPKEVQTLLIDRLAQVYGHPRVNRQAVWDEIDPQLERVFLRWLMGSDIRFLFRVLTEVERGHMWADREEFWWTLYEQGRIDEVWIAFNDAGYQSALRKLPEDKGRTAGRFGRQVGDKDKSLLIMRIGNKIIVEGTYSFKVHIFAADRSKSPKLYQPRYDVAQIRGIAGSVTIPHLGSWQMRVLLALAQ